jgi:hypothetical protein
VLYPHADKVMLRRTAMKIIRMLAMVTVTKVSYFQTVEMNRSAL